MAHGSLDIVKEPNFPIAADRPQKSGLDYLALGDWHGFFKQGRSVYSGTPEQTSYADQDPGNVAIVTITGAGVEPLVQTQRVGVLHWEKIDPYIQDASDIEALERQISNITQNSESVLKVRLQISGSLQAEALDRLKGIRGALKDKLWYLDWPQDFDKASNLTTGRLPPGMLEEVRDLLVKISKGEYPAPDLANLRSNHDPETAIEALNLLYRLSSEGRIDDT